MTDAERDDLIASLVKTLGQISENVEALVLAQREIHLRLEALESPNRGVQ